MVCRRLSELGAAAATQYSIYAAGRWIRYGGGIYCIHVAASDSQVGRCRRTNRHLERIVVGSSRFSALSPLSILPTQTKGQLYHKLPESPFIQHTIPLCDEKKRKKVRVTITKTNNTDTRLEVDRRSPYHAVTRTVTGL